MRKPVVLKGPGATTEDFIRAYNMSPERVALIREILADHGYIKTPSDSRRDKPVARSKKKTASRK